MAVVKLLFVVLGALPRRPQWKKITAWTMQLDSIGEYGSRLALRRGRNYPDNTTDDVEMDTFSVEMDTFGV